MFNFIFPSKRPSTGSISCVKSAHLSFLIVLAVRISSSCVATQILATLFWVLWFCLLAIFSGRFQIMSEEVIPFFHWCFCTQDFSPLSWSGRLGCIITHCSLLPCKGAIITCTGTHLPNILTVSFLQTGSVLFSVALSAKFLVPMCVL